MSNCANHKKELFGQADMKHLADDIGSLHYESLFLLLYHLSKKIEIDSITDYKAGREKLAAALQYAGMSIFESALRMEKVWNIVKPFMSDESPTAPVEQEGQEVEKAIAFMKYAKDSDLFYDFETSIYKK